MSAVNVKQRFLVGIICVGTLLEWAEYTFYGYMAITLSTLFFPEQDPQLAIIKTFGIFAAGYLMRPLGAILFGHVGDRLGRKPALVSSMLLMGLATFAIGCLPTYQTIGMMAPILLLLLRMCQGIAISGEYNGAGIFLTERAGKHNPCLAGSWISASAAWGMVVGGIAAYAISHPLAASWAWRVPFLIGGMSCLVGYWLRRQLQESALFLKDKPEKLRAPLLQSFKTHKKSLLFTAAIAAFTGVYVYIANIYMVVFLKQMVALPTHHATFFAIYGEMIVALLIPLMAYLADKTDAYQQYRRGLFAVALLSPALFILAGTGHYGWILLSMTLYGITNAVLCGPMVKLLTDQFPTVMRYSGISFAWSLSAAMFSGTAPMVAQYLSIKWPLGPSFYVSSMALITAFICFRISGRKQASLVLITE